MIRTLAASALVCAMALGLFGWGTDGWRAFTTEGARRLKVLDKPQPVPAVALQDQDGAPLALDRLRGRYVAVEFIYTRCDTICKSLGMAFKQIREQAQREGFADRLVLVSISFDPERDDPAALRRYAQTFGADGAAWRLARPASGQALAQLLQAFGIVVIPDGLGGYEHNAAIHLMDPQGRLVRIDDLEAGPQFVDAVKRVL